MARPETFIALYTRFLVCLVFFFFFFLRISIAYLTSVGLCHIMSVDWDFARRCLPLTLESCQQAGPISWLKPPLRYLWPLVLNRRKNPDAQIDFPDFWRASCFLICCRLCCKHFFNYFQSSFPQPQHLAVPSDYRRRKTVLRSHFVACVRLLLSSSRCLQDATVNVAQMLYLWEAYKPGSTARQGFPNPTVLSEVSPGCVRRGHPWPGCAVSPDRR